MSGDVGVDGICTSSGDRKNEDQHLLTNFSWLLILSLKIFFL